jgi:hypothetical protein
MTASAGPSSVPDVTCYICLDKFHKSFGQYTNTVKFHPTSDEATSHRIHYPCLISLFKSSIERGVELCCPMCRDPLDMKFIMDIARYTLARCRACESTPGATLRDCPFLLRGFVADIDMEFALRIISEVSKADGAGKRPLASAIVAYWEAPHPAF